MLLRCSFLSLILVLILVPAGSSQSDDPNGWWQDLRGGDAKQAFASMWQFVDHPEQALAFLQKRLRPIGPVEEKIVAQFIQDLNDDSFTVRNRAKIALEKLAELAEPSMRTALAKKPALEVEQTLTRLLKNLADPAANAEQLAQLRALEVLEHISLSPKKTVADQARKLLGDLAHGFPPARLTMKARETLAQVQARSKTPVADAPGSPMLPTNDLFGDPLPKGAAVRLGTNRLRHSLAAFTPDGKILAGVSPAGLFLTDLAAGKETRSFTGKQFEHCLDVTVSPNGRFLAVNYPSADDMGQPEHAVEVWDLLDNKHLHSFAAPQEGVAVLSLSVMAFAADSTLLYVADKTSLHVWDLKTGREKSFFSHALPTERSPGVVVVSPRGKYLLTGSGGERLGHLWEPASGAKHDLDNPARDIGMVSATFSHDEKIAAIGNSNGQVKLYGSAKGELQRTLTTSGKAAGLAFAPDDQTLAVACNDRFISPARAEIYLWNLAKPTEEPRKFPAPNVRWVRFAPDGKTLAWGSWDNVVTLLDPATGKDLYPREAHVGSIQAMVWSGDGKRIATASDDQTVRLWDARGGASLRVFRGHAGEVNSLALSPDGRWLASGSMFDGTVILWDTADGKKKYQLRHHHPVFAVLFSPDGKYLVTGGVDRKFRVREPSIRIFHAATGEQSGVLDRTETSHSLAFSCDGRVLASRGHATVRLLEFPSGKLLHTFDCQERVDGVAFAPDGRSLAIDSSRRETIQLFEMLTKAERSVVPAPLKRNLNYHQRMSISADVRFLASCVVSADFNPISAKQVCVWNLASVKEAGAVAGHRSYVNCVSFSPDGRFLATGSDDATVLIWDCRAAGFGP